MQSALLANSVAELTRLAVVIEIGPPVTPPGIVYGVVAHYEPDCGKWLIEGGNASPNSFMLVSHAVLDSLLHEALDDYGFTVILQDAEGNTLTLTRTDNPKD